MDWVVKKWLGVGKYGIWVGVIGIYVGVVVGILGIVVCGGIVSPQVAVAFKHKHFSPQVAIAKMCLARASPSHIFTKQLGLKALLFSGFQKSVYSGVQWN
jgi:hypothetical protein